MTDEEEKPETIGELFDRLPPGVPVRAYGLRWTRIEFPPLPPLPDPEGWEPGDPIYPPAT